ncbi:MAG: aromatic ring-hydroxylating dioxygenase subunit alpha [Burkholderiales bacterium]|nr:aromatic ring-hydroxylating dioxygenase subunit alpha [Burkholderiales bacterium]
MALPDRTATQLESIRRQCAAGQPEWGDAETHIPVSAYVDAVVWQAEVEGLFRRLPLVAAHSGEIAPGQVLAHDACGVPLLLARDDAGTLRAFLNVCRHRGMRLVEASGAAESRASVTCPYHGWTYKLSGELRHRLHAEAFDACPAGERDLVALPCEERHGLVWVIAQPGAAIDVASWLGGLDKEFAFCEVDRLQPFRTVHAEYDANWKLVVDAFLEPYHIRVLHRDTIYPFFADGITAAERFGPHIASLVARRTAQEWAAGDAAPPATFDELRLLATPSQVIFPNTITIFHPDYLSLVSLYPVAPQRLRWTHRMLIPRDKATSDWAPHWEKTFELIERGVFQREDIRCAIAIQQGFASGANRWLTAGRVEQGLAWFHRSVAQHAGLPAP